eukprot:SAG31_NODE_11233_length_1051_cov_1.040966_1_plen_67_part_10
MIELRRAGARPRSSCAYHDYAKLELRVRAAHAFELGASSFELRDRAARSSRARRVGAPRSAQFELRC